MPRNKKRWKGCCLLCNLNKSMMIRGGGQARRTRFSDLRRLGVKRRLMR